MSDTDLKAQQEARDAVEAASRAFSVLGRFDQEKIDTICEAMSQAALAEAGRLGHT
jgi:acyl-CoA reductase-like NAD-dependent aldehyde dehydrogenase